MKSKKTKKQKNNVLLSGMTNYPITIQDIQNRILGVMKKSKKSSLNTKQIASGVQTQTTDKLFESALNELVKNQKLEIVTEYKYKLRLIAEQYKGVFEIGKDGISKVKVDLPGKETKEVVILSNGSEKAFNGDLVSIKLLEGSKGNLKGRVTEIIKRKRTKFVGTIDFISDHPYFIPQDSKIKTDFAIPEKNLKGAKHGDKVVIELIRWTKEKPVGNVVEILGAGGSHHAEMNSIMIEYGLTDIFPENVLLESESFSDKIPKSEIKNRRDFRNILTFTIDPADAKDFDDAISFSNMPNGNFEIGVHIADVTYYVREGSALDQEAYERATSVYLVDRVIPMLPEKLSNNLCSLVPNQDRLTYSAVFEITPEGKIVNEWFGRTIIHSNRRFSYEEVQLILDTGNGDFYCELSELNRLAYILREDRFAKGSINFDTEEVKFKLDEEGKPIEVYRKERKDSHKLIEDFMLLANRSVAKFISSKKKDIPFVYRVHPSPDIEKLTKLNQLVKNFGYNLDLKNEKSISKSLNELVIKVVGTPEQAMIQSASIRSMPKAIYTSNNIGHYGLGFKHYTHFTSPIRRYPDVLVHRILDKVLSKNYKNINDKELEIKCKHSSERERIATDAERSSIKFKQVEFMDSHIGKILDGVISGVTQWGVYVELDGNHCEGLIPIREIRDDHYNIDETGFRLIGQTTGRMFSLGDKIRVKVNKTNLLKKQIDFLLIGKISELEKKSKQNSGIECQKSEEILIYGSTKKSLESNDYKIVNNHSPNNLPNRIRKEIHHTNRVTTKSDVKIGKNNNTSISKHNQLVRSNKYSGGRGSGSEKGKINNDSSKSQSEKNNFPDLSWKEDEKKPF